MMFLGKISFWGLKTFKKEKSGTKMRVSGFTRIIFVIFLHDVSVAVRIYITLNDFLGKQFL